MREVDANVFALAERLPAPLVADLATDAGAAPPDPLDRASLRMLGLAV